ncbi:MAG: PKD domain-containing protein [Candidatus Cloacimonadales bacterium]
MQKIVIFLVFAFVIISLSATAKQALFIGNSITYMGEIPQKFETIADAFGDSVDVTLHTPSGTGIGDHVDSESLYETIRQGSWDYFIIQPGSGESPGTSTPPEITLERIETILDSVYYYNPYVQPLIYQISCRTWGHTAEELATYNETMDTILDNVQYWADNTETFLAPVGETLREAWNENQDILFWYDFDDIHLNEHGSYLAACVFYATIFQKTSSGSEYLGNLSAEVAAEYQARADNMTLNNFPDWRINTYNFWLDFQVEQISNQISISNLSQNLDNCFWDFGDGTTSADFEPEHSYQAEGVYEITMQANVTYNSGVEAVLEKTEEITVDEVIVNAETNIVEPGLNIMVYPNPARLGLNNQINFSLNLAQVGEYSLVIFNLKGQRVKTLTGVKNNSGEDVIIWDGLDEAGKLVSSGLYFSNLHVGEQVYQQKLMLLK